MSAKTELSNIAVLVPAYKPEKELMIPFLHELIRKFSRIVVVDDGGGTAFDEVFDACREMGVTVLTHEFNMGKGTALKTGIAYIRNRCEGTEGIVTADCDGQHSVEDIVRVAEKLCQYPNKLIIGGRRFDENVPTRSQLGNSMTRNMYKLATGISIYDTQTGLRAFGRKLFDKMLTLNGSRYEYEMNMLLKLREWGVEAEEITIKTIYIDENKGSHYNTVKDSARIAVRIFKYLAASLISTIADYTVYVLIVTLTALGAGLAFGCARVVSSVVNYLLNRHIVFKGKTEKGSAVKYFALAAIVMLLGMGVIALAEKFIQSKLLLTLVKLLYDAIMYFVNYVIQRDFVFKTKKN